MSTSTPVDSYALLKELVTLTSPFIGDTFFSKSTEAFGSILGADWVFVAHVLDVEKTQVKVLGAWKNVTNMDSWEFPLEGTPCNVIYEGANNDQHVAHIATDSCVHIPRDMCEIFPAAKGSGFQSFLGLPLWPREGEMIGHVATFFREPLPSQGKAEQ